MKQRLLMMVTVGMVIAPVLFRGVFHRTFARQQDKPTGVIRGTVVREGTSDPIPGVQITLNRRGPGAGLSTAMNVQQAQRILESVASKTSTVPPELVQAAQEAVRGTSTLPQPAGPQTVTSDGEGHFVFNDLPVADYNVRAQLEGFFGAPVDGTYPTVANVETSVSDQKIADVRVSMLPGGTVTGRVLDSNGKPASDTPVYALRSSYQNGIRTLQVANSKSTDDRGEYRLYRLPPGEYYLAAVPRNTRPAGNTAERPLTTFYPNVIDAALTAPLVLRAGTENPGLDIQVVAAPLVKVTGRVLSLLPPGPVVDKRTNEVRPPSAVIVLMPRGNQSLPGLFSASGIPSNPDTGAFEIPNVPPGSYTIYARLPTNYGWGPQQPPERATGPSAFGFTSVEVNGPNDVNGITVAVRDGTELKGRIFIDGKPGVAMLRIGLESDNGAQGVNDTQISGILGQIAQFSPVIADDGSFSIPSLPDGRYRVRVTLNAPANVPQDARGSSSGPRASGPAGAQGPAAASRGSTSGAGSTAGPNPGAQTSTPPRLPTTAHVADIRQDAYSVYDNGLTIDGGAANPISVLINTGSGRIEGAVTRAEQKPAPNTLVVLVPPPDRRQNPLLYRSMRTDNKGLFKMENVPPGEYTVLASENAPSGAYQNAEFLKSVEHRGAHVTVQNGGASNVAVELIPDESQR